MWGHCLRGPGAFSAQATRAGGISTGPIGGPGAAGSRRQGQCPLPAARGRRRGRAGRKGAPAEAGERREAAGSGGMRGRQREQHREQRGRERGRALPAAVGVLCRALPPRARPAPDTLRRARFDRPQAVSAGRSARRPPPAPRRLLRGTGQRGASPEWGWARGRGLDGSARGAEPWDRHLRAGLRCGPASVWAQLTRVRELSASSLLWEGLCLAVVLT